MSAFGTGSNSYGQFWFGGNTFPGFLFKRNLGVGARRSTKFNPGGNITCNNPTYLYNKYKPGAGGVGASSMSNRRAKNRLATVCGPNQCFPCYNTLGQYSNYTHNPNGFIPCPAITDTSSSSSSGSVTPTPTPSVTYTLRYLNTASGGTAPAPTTSYSVGSSVPILGNTFTNTFNPTYLFGGWNTASDGRGTYYPAGSNLTIPYTNTILWAQWYNPTVSASNPNLTVTYFGNGSTGGSPPATVSTYKANQGIPISATPGTLVNPGFTFYGWNTSANGLGTSYPANSNGFTIVSNSNVNLYAIWVNTSTNYTLTYDDNGSTGGTVPAPQTPYPSGASAEILGQSNLVKSGYTFLGWNTAANGSGTSYLTNNSIVMSSDKTLYAQWFDGTSSKDCGIFTGVATIPGSSFTGISFTGSRALYRNNTSNTFTITIPTYYGNSNAGPFGTGTGPTDTSHTGNLLSSYATATISESSPGSYQITVTYTTNWSSQSAVVQQLSTPLILSSTYWPAGETVSGVTITSPALVTGNFSFDTSGGNFLVTGGCYGSVVSASPLYTFASIIAFYINFTNGYTTRVAFGTEFRWNTPSGTLPYTYVYNYARVEVQYGLITAGVLSNISSTGVNTV